MARNDDHHTRRGHVEEIHDLPPTGKDIGRLEMGKNMVTFTPASDIWTLGYDQFGKSCWQNKQTQELRYNLPEEGLALPPRSSMDAPHTGFPEHTPFSSAAVPHAEANESRPILPNRPSFTPAGLPRAAALPMKEGPVNTPHPSFPNGIPFTPTGLPRAGALPMQGSLTNAPHPSFPDGIPFNPAGLPRAAALPVKEGPVNAPHPSFPNGILFTPAGLPRAEALPMQGSLTNAPHPSFPNGIPFNPAGLPRAAALPMKEGPVNAPHPSLPIGPPFNPAASAGGFPMLGHKSGVEFYNSAHTVPQTSNTGPASSAKEGSKSGPSLPLSRADEAKQWSRKRDDRGEYYFNSVTGESQFAKPDCLKKYTCRR